MDYPTEIEDLKYSEIYAEGYNPINIGKSNRLKRFSNWICSHITIPINSSVLDYSCGYGVGRHLVPYSRYVGIDISSYLIEYNQKSNPELEWLQSDGMSLPFEDNEFDYLISTDVLEHIVPEHIDQILSELFRVTKSQLVSVCTQPSKSLDKQGGNLHLLVQDHQWWLDKFINVKLHEISGTHIMIISGDTVVTKIDPYAKYSNKIRRGADGTIWIPRSIPELEKQLDHEFIRHKNQLRWSPKVQTDQDVTLLTDIYKNQTAYIVGKGPSLDHLTIDYFTTSGPVFAINDAIKKVESLGLSNPIYLIQGDIDVNAEPTLPDTQVILQNQIKHKYHNHVKYVHNPFQWGFPHGSLSAMVGVKIAKLAGCSEIKMLCFDAAVNQNCEYAECVGHASDATGRKKERFLGHRSRIEAVAELPLEWLLPIADQSPEACDKQLLLQDNLEGHHENDDAQYESDDTAKSD